MKALRIAEPGRTEMVDVEEPALGPADPGGVTKIHVDVGGVL